MGVRKAAGGDSSHCRGLLSKPSCKCCCISHVDSLLRRASDDKMRNKTIKEIENLARLAWLSTAFRAAAMGASSLTGVPTKTWSATRFFTDMPAYLKYSLGLFFEPKCHFDSGLLSLPEAWSSLVLYKPDEGDHHHRLGSYQGIGDRSPISLCTAPCTEALKLRHGTAPWRGGRKAVSWLPGLGKDSLGWNSRRHRRGDKYAHKSVSWSTSQGRALCLSHRHIVHPVCGHTWAG